MIDRLVTPSKTGAGPVLSTEQNDLVRLLDSFASERSKLLADHSTSVAALIGELSELGVWTIGASEDAGGAGADAQTSIVVWERLGRYWPAVSWASVQASATLGVIGGSAVDSSVGPDIAAGRSTVAVVERSSLAAALTISESTLNGSVARVDAAHSFPHVLLLDGQECLFVHQEHVNSKSLRRTGLGGAFSSELTFVNAPYTRLTSTSDLRLMLRRGAVASAAGIAGAAADAADDYVRARRQFGRALIDFPTVRQSIRAQHDFAATTLLALVRADTPAAMESVFRLVWQGLIDTTAAALQAHGGYGYLSEYPVEQHLRDALSLQSAVAGLADTHQRGLA